MLVDGTWLEVVGRPSFASVGKNPSAIELVSFSMFCDILSWFQHISYPFCQPAPLAVF